MIGGVIINVIRLNGSTWVQCLDSTYGNDTRAIRIKNAPADMKVGDRLWWQSRWAMWTPKPDDGREDVHLERDGYSHSAIPDDVIETVA